MEGARGRKDRLTRRRLPQPGPCSNPIINDLCVCYSHGRARGRQALHDPTCPTDSEEWGCGGDSPCVFLRSVLPTDPHVMLLELAAYAAAHTGTAIATVV